jgi:hypothetical protein
MMKFISILIALMLLTVTCVPQEPSDDDAYLKRKKRAVVSTGAGSAFVQACTPAVSNPTVTSITITCTGVVAGHALVIMGNRDQNNTSVACSDSSSSTYPAATLSASNSGGIGYGCYTLNELGSGTITITVTIAPASSVTALAEEISGVTSLDQSATAITGSSTSWTWGAVTNTASGITVAGGGSLVTDATVTAGAGFTLPANGQVTGGAGQQFGVEMYKLTTATTVTPTATISNAMAGEMITLSFK